MGIVIAFINIITHIKTLGAELIYGNTRGISIGVLVWYFFSGSIVILSLKLSPYWRLMFVNTLWATVRLVSQRAWLYKMFSGVVSDSLNESIMTPL